MQFAADSGDAYNLTKAAFDGGALSTSWQNGYTNFYDWTQNAFCLGVSLHHNDDQATAHRLISGLNTSGSNIPIQYQVNSMSTTLCRPIVFLEMTSTLMIVSKCIPVVRWQAAAHVV